MGVLEHPSITTAFGKAVNRAIDHGKTQAILELAKAGQLSVEPEAAVGFNADAPTQLTAALKELKELELPHISQLERDQDQPINVIFAGLTLPRHSGEGAEQEADYYLKPDVSQLKVPIFAHPRHILDPFRLVDEIPLLTSLTAHANRCARKKGIKGKAILCGLGNAHQPRSDGVPVMVATVSLSDAQLLTRMEEAKEAALAGNSSPLRRTYSI